MSEKPEGRKKLRGRFWWIDRWRKSSAFIEMTLAEQGAYHNLLDEQRLRGGLIPNDDRLLSRACGDPLEWPSIKEKLLRWFEVTPDGKHILNATANEVNDATDAISAAASVGGKARAAADRQRSGSGSSAESQRIVSGSTSDSPADEAAESQPPLSVSVVSSPLSVSDSVSGRTEERRACGHPAIAGRVRPGKTVVCPDCGEEFRGSSADGGPKLNPFVQADGRDKWELEALRLTREVAALTGEDGAEIFTRAAHYEGALLQKCNPTNLTDDRLLNTVLDLRATLKAAQEQRAKVGASA